MAGYIVVGRLWLGTLWLGRLWLGTLWLGGCDWKKKWIGDEVWGRGLSGFVGGLIDE